MKNPIIAKSLTEAQLLVLQVVKNQDSDQDLEDLRVLLLDFNHRKMQQHLDEVVTEKNYTSSDFENILSGHMRKTR